MYPDVQLFIDGKWCAAEGGNTIDVFNPATNEAIGKVASASRADLDRALASADRGFKVWRKVSAFERSKVLRRAADLMRERADKIAAILYAGAGQAGRRSQGGGADRRRPLRLVRRRRPPHLWPDRAGARRAACTSSCCASRSAPWRRSRRGTSRSTRRCARSARARHRLLDHRQGAGGNSRLARLPVRHLQGRGPAGRRAQHRLRHPAGDLRLSHAASDHPEDVLHRLDCGWQAARGAGRHAYEARHHGTRRPCAGDRVRRRRHRRRRRHAGRRQVPQRRPGLRVADAIPGPGKLSTSASSTSSSSMPRR